MCRRKHYERRSRSAMKGRIGKAHEKDNTRHRVIASNNRCDSSTGFFIYVHARLDSAWL